MIIMTTKYYGKIDNDDDGDDSDKDDGDGDYDDDDNAKGQKERETSMQSLQSWSKVEMKSSLVKKNKKMK